MNNFFQKITELTNGKKVIIYGFGYVGKVLLLMLEKMGIEVEYVVDRNWMTLQQTADDVFDTDYCIKSPYDILYENKEKTIVFLAVSQFQEIESFLEEAGWEKNNNFWVVTDLKYQAVNLIDPFLGYSRIGSQGLYGMEVYGNQDARYKILVGGGSTTDHTFFGIKSWPQYLYELLKDEDVCIFNGGIVGYNSSQEVLKLIRDGLLLKPDMVISYSGINEPDYLEKSGKHPMVSAYTQNVLNQFAETSSSGLKMGYGIEDGSSAACTWLKNEKLMKGICDSTGIAFYSFFQPSLFSVKGGYHFSEYEKKQIRCCTESHRAKYISFYQEMEQYEFPDYIIDARDFLGEDTDLFLDVVHCSEKANQRIAGNIYSVIRREAM